MTRDEEEAVKERVAKACVGMEPIEAASFSELSAKGVQLTTMISIAISLKRIADKLELSTKQPVIMTAEEYKRHTADQFIKNRM